MKIALSRIVLLAAVVGGLSLVARADVQRRPEGPTPPAKTGGEQRPERKIDGQRPPAPRPAPKDGHKHRRHRKGPPHRPAPKPTPAPAPGN